MCILQQVRGYNPSRYSTPDDYLYPTRAKSSQVECLQRVRVIVPVKKNPPRGSVTVRSTG